MLRVFLSYARIDGEQALRLQRALSRGARVHVWFDQFELKAGMKWKPAIWKAIRGSGYVVALVSERSVSGRGFRDREVALAWKLVEEFSERDVFLIPARLDDCTLPRRGMKELGYADLFPAWRSGVAKLRSEMKLESNGVRRSTARAVASARVTDPYEIKLLDLSARLESIGGLARKLNRVQDIFRFEAARLPVPSRSERVIDGSHHLDVQRLPETFFESITPTTSDYAICLTD